MGLAAGQTLLLAVVRSTQLMGDVPPGPCDALLVMTGPDGAMLAAMTTGALMPGNAAVLAFNTNMLRLSLGQRIEVQGSLFARPDGGSMAGCIASGQLVDNASQWTTTMLVNQ